MKTDLALEGHQRQIPNSAVMLALIQRLREAEDQVRELLAMAEDDKVRIAQLERVREAAAEVTEVSHRIALVSFATGELTATGKTFYTARDRLAAALAAVEEPVKG